MERGWRGEGFLVWKEVAWRLRRGKTLCGERVGEGTTSDGSPPDLTKFTSQTSHNDRKTTANER